jgi:signal transduction histidine kinase
MTSHEFRTPLATILSSSELLNTTVIVFGPRSWRCCRPSKALSRMTRMLDCML